MYAIPPKSTDKYVSKPPITRRFDDPIISFVHPRPVIVDIAPALKVLTPNSLRAGYRIFNHIHNYGTVYHDYVNTVSTISYDYVKPGGVLEDVGEWQTVHQGDVWIISSHDNTAVRIEEIIVTPKWYYAYIQDSGFKL